VKKEPNKGEEGRANPKDKKKNQKEQKTPGKERRKDYVWRRRKEKLGLELFINKRSRKREVRKWVEKRGNRAGAMRRMKLPQVP